MVKKPTWGVFGNHIQSSQKCNYVTPEVELKCSLENSIQTVFFLIPKVERRKIEFEITPFVSN